VATTTLLSANRYYEKLVDGVNDIDLRQWEDEIRHAENTRLQDRSVMDILGAKSLQRDQAADEAQSDNGSGHKSDIEWIQLAINIEEKQYVMRIAEAQKSIYISTGLKYKILSAAHQLIQTKTTKRMWIGCAI
jgi:hypothetical protein